MNYSAEELFEFTENPDEDIGGYAVNEYLKKDNPTITELVIPSEYKGTPVTMLYMFSFCDSEYLRHITIPGSVRFIGEGAFAFCGNLEIVEFEGAPIKVSFDVFFGCERLPIEKRVVGLVRSTDITNPVSNDDLKNEASYQLYYSKISRPEIFEFLAKNDCFRECDITAFFKRVIDDNVFELFTIAEEYGTIPNGEAVDELIKHAVERQTTEITAYLLDLKNRKFNFDKGDKYEL